MNKFLVAMLVVFSQHALALEDVHKPFDATHNMTNKVEITWMQDDNIRQACDTESRRRGGPGFRYAVEACSFWDRKPTGWTCTIITERTANMHTLGHETRHCFQGNWHPEK